jgi:hypothetical protein
MDYDYTDLSDADDVERQSIWKYKYLGIMPKDENYRRVVEEYIKNAENK